MLLGGSALIAIVVVVGIHGGWLLCVAEGRGSLVEVGKDGWLVEGSWMGRIGVWDLKDWDSNSRDNKQRQ